MALFTLVGVVVLAAACSKCDDAKPVASGAASGLLRHLPVSAEAVAVVPDLGVLGDRITLLQSRKLATFVAQLQGFPDANAFVNALMQQVGVDLRSRDALKKIGIEPDRGLGVALLEGDVAYAVVAVSDARAFGEALQTLSRNRLGAGTVNRSTVDGREHVFFSRGVQKEPQPALAYLIVDGFALVSAGPGAARLPELAKLPAAQSVAEAQSVKDSLSRLPKERDVWVHVPASVTSARKPPLVGFTAVMHLSKDALRIVADAPWQDSAQTLEALKAQKVEVDLSVLPQDAFAVARYAGSPESLQAVWPLLAGPHLQRAFAQAKVDVQQEVLAQLKPGIVASLSVAPDIPLGAGMPELDVRRTNPFRYVQLVATATAKDPAKVAPLLSRMPEIAPRFGAQISALEREGQTLYTTKYARGEGVHFAGLGDGRVVFASPLPRMEQTLTRLKAAEGGQGPLTDAPLRSFLAEHAVSVVVDLDKLRSSVKALPQEAWGIGGFAIKASAIRWLDATDDLRAVTIGVSGREKTVQTELALRFTAQ